MILAVLIVLWVLSGLITVPRTARELAHNFKNDNWRTRDGELPSGEQYAGALFSAVIISPLWPGILAHRYIIHSDAKLLAQGKAQEKRMRELEAFCEKEGFEVP